jgi:hypothetical protein
LNLAASAVAGAAALSALSAGTASAQVAAPELLPDLIGQPAQDLSIQESGGTRNLRLATTVANAGAGPLEVYPVSGGDCDGDGNPANDRLAYQRVFRDVDGSGDFSRAVDVDSAAHLAGCMIFHPAHMHWHFEDFASYQLREPGSGTVVAANSKVSFCMIDSSPFYPALPGFAASRFFTSCDQDDAEGISVGWGDTYGSSLAGQTIDVTGLPDGDYCLAVTGDPSDILRESDEQDNEAVTPIFLSEASVRASAADCRLGAPHVDNVTASGHVHTTVIRCNGARKSPAGKARKKRRRCHRERI